MQLVDKVNSLADAEHRKNMNFEVWMIFIVIQSISLTVGSRYYDTAGIREI
jgi:hypothetical protein